MQKFKILTRKYLKEIQLEKRNKTKTPNTIWGFCFKKLFFGFYDKKRRLNFNYI